MSAPVQWAEDDVKAEDERTMNDHSLKRGDILTTSKGFFIFVGPDEGDRQPSDFIALPGSR